MFMCGLSVPTHIVAWVEGNPTDVPAITGPVR